MRAVGRDWRGAAWWASCFEPRKQGFAGGDVGFALAALAVGLDAGNKAEQETDGNRCIWET